MDNLSGMQLGPYQILKRMGQGGMATVYRAEWLGHNMEVAVKVLPPSLAENPEFVARFKREADTLARLQHPYIVPLIDFGEFGGYLYMVMPIMSGGTLADRIKTEGVLPLPEIQKAIAQVGSALEHAHKQNMIHRDVKPANVLIDNQGNYCLTDFGIAKLYEATGRFTNTGTLLGTPAYMSPEQARGKPLDHRSDLYSLGVVLYEMATGRVPFYAETPIAIVLMHIEDTLPSPRSLNAAIPPKLEKVLQKAMAKKPEDRYQSMGEFSKALQAVGEANILPATQQLQPAAAPPSVVMAKPITPAKPLPPLPETPAPLTPARSGVPGWLWAGGAVLGLLVLIACVASLLVAALPGTFAPPTLTPSRTPSPVPSPTARRATATPSPAPTLSPTPIPVIWQIVNNAPVNPVAQGEQMTVQDGTPLLLSITDLALGNASHWHLLRGAGAATLAQDQVLVNLEPDSEAFINSGPFSAGAVFKPQLPNYPDLAFAGVGCLAASYDIAQNQMVFACYAGTCQYVVTPELQAWTNVAVGKQVVFTLDNMTPKESNIREATTARYRTVLQQSDLGKEDEAVCLEHKPIPTLAGQATATSSPRPNPSGSTNTPPPAATATSRPGITPPTNTMVPPVTTAAPAASPTKTQGSVGATNTPVNPPTNTPVTPPTPVPSTNTPIPTNTSIPPSATPVPPTDTPYPTDPPEPTCPQICP